MRVSTAICVRQSSAAGSGMLCQNRTHFCCACRRAGVGRPEKHLRASILSRSAISPPTSSNSPCVLPLSFTRTCTPSRLSLTRALRPRAPSPNLFAAKREDEPPKPLEEKRHSSRACRASSNSTWSPLAPPVGWEGPEAKPPRRVVRTASLASRHLARSASCVPMPSSAGSSRWCWDNLITSSEKGCRENLPGDWDRGGNRERERERDLRRT